MSVKRNGKLIPAVAYIRMSSERQEASPDQQRAEVARLAKREGYRIIREYFDQSISGDATEKRADFQRMIRDAEEKADFAAILCWDQDRFGRFDSIEAGKWIYPLRQAGVRLVTVAQGAIDWNDFTGRVMYGIVQEGKHQFLIDLSRNVLRGRIASAKRGSMVVTPPYGYDRMFHDEAGREVKRVPGGQKFNKPTGWSVKLVPAQNSEEVETVKWLFHRFAYSDCSLRSLVVELNEQGVRTRRGGVWNSVSVQYLLTHPVYTGALVFGRHRGGKYHQVAPDGDLSQDRAKGYREPPIVVEGTHEPLVDSETFLRVQAKLRQRSNGKRAPRRDAYILSGVAHCGHCGRPLSGRSGGANRPRRYYTCPGGNNGDCQKYNVRQDYLDDYVLDAIHKRLSRPDAIDQIIHAIHQKVKATPKFKGRAANLKRKLDALDRKIAKGRENLLLADPEHIAELSGVLEEWKAERAEVEAELEAIATQAGGATPDERTSRAIQELDRLRQHLQCGDRSKVRAVIKAMVEDIRLWWETDGKRYRKLVKGVLTFRGSVGFAQGSSSTVWFRPRWESGGP
jgi:DNA invertase Pin-like site-specific DNA recombinase